MNLEQQLHAALAPCEPGPRPLVAVMARISAAQSRRSTRRSFNKPVLLGCFLVLAAAASMLVLRRVDVSSPQRAAEVATDSPLPIITEKGIPVDVSGQAAPEAASPYTPLSSTKPFTVRVRLENNATNPSAIRAIDDFHAALLDVLRSIPGLVFVTEEPAAYRLTLHGTDHSVGKFRIRLDAESVASGTVMPIVISGDIAPECAATGALNCSDPHAHAVFILKLLRMSVFPSTPVSPQVFKARILDTSLSAGERLNALMESSPPRVAALGESATDRPKTLFEDPQIIRSLVDLAATSSDPVIRARVWDAVRDRHIAAFIPALSDALRRDSDEKVRAVAATTLLTDFAADPQARVALEVAAQQDPALSVRAIARRGVSGDTAWNDYVISSLKDTSLTPRARIEPVSVTVNRQGRVPDLDRLLIDDEAIEAFADAFSRIEASEGLDASSIALLGRVSSIYHPAITGLFLDSLDHATQQAVRQSIVGQLTRRSADARVQAVLRKLSVEDADPELRKMAIQALR